MIEVTVETKVKTKVFKTCDGTFFEDKECASKHEENIRCWNDIFTTALKANPSLLRRYRDLFRNLYRPSLLEDDDVVTTKEDFERTSSDSIYCSECMMLGLYEVLLDRGINPIFDMLLD